MKTLAKYFFEGLLVLLPAVASVYFVYLVFAKVDGLLGFDQRGVGFVVTLALITGVGAVASNVVGRRLLGLMELLLTRVPLVKLLYTSLRDFVGALVGEQKSFDRPVVVSLGEHGSTKAFGFVTCESLTEFGLPGHVAVYFPQSVNFAGHLLLFPRDRVTPLEVDHARFMAFVVSGGVVSHEPSVDR